jgi:hypothetical protein
MILRVLCQKVSTAIATVSLAEAAHENDRRLQTELSHGEGEPVKHPNS